MTDMIKNKTIIKLSALTDVGIEREHNEDNFLIISDVGTMSKTFGNSQETNLPERGTLLVVADGMGGMSSGEVASRLAIESVNQDFSELQSKEMPDVRSLKSFLKEVIHNAQTRIIQHQHQYPETQGMGTTLVIAWLCNSDKVYVAWVGDSRCYVYNESQGLKQLSKDHSYVQELIDAGKITEEQAFYHPDSNIVTQSLGSEKHNPKPDVVEYSLQINDKLLLCSDGLNGMLQDSEIASILSQTPDLDECRQSLIDTANQAGGNDNITVALCDIVAIPPLSTLESKTTWKTAKYLYVLVTLFVILAVVLLSPILWSSFQGNKESSDGESDSTKSAKSETRKDTLKVSNKSTGLAVPEKNENVSDSQDSDTQTVKTDAEKLKSNADSLEVKKIEIMEGINKLRLENGKKLKEQVDKCENAKSIQTEFYETFKKYVYLAGANEGQIDYSKLQDLPIEDAATLKKTWDTAQTEISEELGKCLTPIPIKD